MPPLPPAANDDDAVKPKASSKRFRKPTQRNNGALPNHLPLCKQIVEPDSTIRPCCACQMRRRKRARSWPRAGGSVPALKGRELPKGPIARAHGRADNPYMSCAERGAEGPREGEPMPSGQLLVIVVEDDADMSWAMESVLNAAGFDAAMFPSGCLECHCPIDLRHEPRFVCTAAPELRDTCI